MHVLLILITGFTAAVLAPIFNVVLLFQKPLQGDKRLFVFFAELFCILLGLYCTAAYCSATDITPSDWDKQLYNAELHSPLQRDSLLTFGFLLLLSFAAHTLLRFIRSDAMPPLCAVLCIAALYLGMAECILWCVQISKEPHVLYYLLPVNVCIIYVRTIRDTVLRRAEQEVAGDGSRLQRLLCRAKNWPWLSLILSVPLLGVITAVLLLFGQKPDALIRMWSETADWTFSEKLPPPNIQYDEHYLCTVAATGHRVLVKPLRIGIRHGHRVVVNRQLMVANAFEALLQERMPRTHKVIRKTYDTLGYPIARHIRSPFVSDAIYLLMKPLEWFFLAVLYLFERKPENRIAVQYPHTEPPVIR